MPERKWKKCMVCRELVKSIGCDGELIDICPGCYYTLLRKGIEIGRKL